MFDNSYNKCFSTHKVDRRKVLPEVPLNFISYLLKMLHSLFGSKKKQENIISNILKMDTPCSVVNGCLSVTFKKILLKNSIIIQSPVQIKTSRSPLYSHDIFRRLYGTNLIWLNFC